MVIMDIVRLYDIILNGVIILIMENLNFADGHDQNFYQILIVTIVMTISQQFLSPLLSTLGQMFKKISSTYYSYLTPFPLNFNIWECLSDS